MDCPIFTRPTPPSVAMSRSHRTPRILVVTSVDVERVAVLRGITSLEDQVDVICTGVGSIAAATYTSIVLSTKRDEYDSVVCAGIGGGFAEEVGIGSLVLADYIVAVNLGAETVSGDFISVDELGLGSSTLLSDATRTEAIATAWTNVTKLPIYRGAALTVCTTTGTKLTAARLKERVPMATCEAMEGYGVAMAAKAFGIPMVELRAISNIVGPRDRSSWDIEGALHVLEKASGIVANCLLKEVFL